MHAERDLYGFEYHQYPWGDLIYGSKAEIQALGVAAGLAFPGELGGPKRTLRARDARGFVVEIGRAYDGERYCASIRMPGREDPSFRAPWEPFCEGVQKRCWGASDNYRGSAVALIAAGLVQDGQLPGQSGMRKVRVTINAHGTVVDGPKNANLSTTARAAGARVIEKCGKATFIVSVKVSEEERKRRWNEMMAARAAWERRMAALPRPLPLTVLAGVSRPRKPSHLRLVWSAPA
jgi:hypothetical protein